MIFGTPEIFFFNDLSFLLFFYIHLEKIFDLFFMDFPFVRSPVFDLSIFGLMSVLFVILILKMLLTERPIRRIL